jgi:hypothetical protein
MNWPSFIRSNAQRVNSYHATIMPAVILTLACSTGLAEDTTKKTAVAEEASLRQSQPQASLPNDSPGIRLAKKHMGELLPLIEHLRKRSPAQYEKAIRDLDRSAKRLESLRKRDAKLFEIALQEWTTRTELQLAKAKLRVGKSSGGSKKIRDHQTKLLDLQIQRLHRETELLSKRRANYEERVSQLNVQIERANELRLKLEKQKDELRSDTSTQEL